MSGYASPAYACSLAEFGDPLALGASGGWFLTRQIGENEQDAMGCYPLFACRDWSRLKADIDDLEGKLVSVALVADPFGAYDEKLLAGCFDFARPFKEHFVTDLNVPAEDFVSKHHQYYARKAAAEMDVEIVANPAAHLEDWVALYAELVDRHDLRGIKAFSRSAFALQLAMPQMMMLRATCGVQTLAAHLWLVSGDIAYSHLAASSRLGYEKMASYALYASAIQYFRDRVRWLHLGSGAGMSSETAGGLSQFKKGWSTGTRIAYFCGRILNKVRYEQLVKEKNAGNSAYFPAYRAGEFA